MEDQETTFEYRAIGRACQNELLCMGSVPCRVLLWSQTGTGSNSPLLCDCFMQLPNVFPSECPQHQDLALCYCKPLSLSSTSKKEAERQVLLKMSSYHMTNVTEICPKFLSMLAILSTKGSHGNFSPKKI